MSQTKIETRDPINQLKPLPFVKAMPRWATKSDSFGGLVEDIRENGIKHPLLITASNQVIDGETRRQAAVALQLMEVPCIVVPDNEVQETIVRETVRRRNLTKGQLAYVICPLIESAYHESLRRRASNASKTKPTELVSFSGVKEWSKLLGISEELLRQARELHKEFERNPKIRAEWESAIFNFDEPMSIGAVRAGIGGSKVSQEGREEKMAYTQMSLALERIGENAEVWNDETKRGQIIEEWQKAASKIPAKIRKAIIEVLQNA